MREIAEFCREYWSEIANDRDSDTLDDEDIARIYFELPVRSRGMIPGGKKLSHRIPILSDVRDRLKDGGAPPFSSADHAQRISSQIRWPPKKIVTPTAASRSLRDP